MATGGSTRHIIRSRLQATQDFVSGEELAAECGISRTSVWKAIKALQADGYQIAAISNRGYRLTAVPDHIDGERISQTLAALGVADCAVTVFDSLDSTLSESKRQCAAVGAFRSADGALSADGARLHRSLIVTGQQTAGRGRMGRVFASPANSGVYFTVIYAPKAGVTNAALLTAMAAVAVARAVDELCGTHARIKWVNDVFLGEKKICGILTEGVTNFETGRIDAANVGIGINVHSPGFSGELAAVAGSIDEALDSANAAEGCEVLPVAAENVITSNTSADGSTVLPPACDSRVPRVTRNDVVAHTVAHLLALYDALENGDDKTVTAALAEYRARSLVIGKVVTVTPLAGQASVPYQARVLGIDDTAALIVQTTDGTRQTLRSGEVSLHGTHFFH